METFWITGASSGIGEALARKLSDEGHRLILSGRNEEKLQALKDQLKSEIKLLPFDLRDASSEVVSKAYALFPEIDVVILNAGLSQRSLAADTDLAVYRDLMEVNYFGNVALTQALLPHFLKKNKGHFVVISSLVGKFGTPFRSGYSASKHALHGYYDSLRAELMMEDKNIQVTVICPGFVATNISYNALSGNGHKLGKFDDANAEGLSPDDFAKSAIEAIRKKELEVYIGGKETFGVFAKRFFPRYFAKKISKAKVR